MENLRIVLTVEYYDKTVLKTFADEISLVY